MKKIFLIASVILSFISCKKNYTCNCTTTDKISGSGGVETYEYKNTSAPYSEKMSKSKAEAACNHEEEAIQSSYKNWWTENGTTSDPNVSSSTSCNLK